MYEEEIKQEAEDFAREHKRRIADERTSADGFPSEAHPVSVFMAGSPGAGKTEASKNLLKKFSPGGTSIIRIDPDELREYFSAYTGANSYLFQGAVSILVEKIHDNALANNQSFIFDSTFANLSKAKENIKRSLKHSRFVQIFYVYQDPLQAWDFVQKREALEGRKIPKNKFIDQYYQARDNVNLLKKEFGSSIQVDLLVKNIDGTDQLYQENVDVIDNYVPERYSRVTLEDML